MLHLAHGIIKSFLNYDTSLSSDEIPYLFKYDSETRSFTSARCCRVTLPPQISRQTDLVSTFVVDAAAAAAVALSLVALAARETTVASY